MARKQICLPQDPDCERYHVLEAPVLQVVQDGTLSEVAQYQNYSLGYFEELEIVVLQEERLSPALTARSELKQMRRCLPKA